MTDLPDPVAEDFGLDLTREEWDAYRASYQCDCPAHKADAQQAADELTRLTDEMGLYRTDQEAS